MLTDELIYKKLKEDENGCIFEYDRAIYFFDNKKMGLKKLDIQNDEHDSNALAKHEKINKLFKNNLFSELDNTNGGVCDVKWVSKKVLTKLKK